MSDLSTLRGRVEKFLVDQTNTVFSNDTIDEGIRMALKDYNAVSAQRADTTITLSTTAREIDISSVSPIRSVERIWIPYTASAPEHPPRQRRFEHWPAQQKIFVTDRETPSASQVARIFYTLPHTIDNLDSETSTTIPSEDYSTIVLGAAGYSATSRSLDIAEEVTIDRDTQDKINDWGNGVLERFNKQLDQIGQRESIQPRTGYERATDRDESEWK